MLSNSKPKFAVRLSLLSLTTLALVLGSVSRADEGDESEVPADEAKQESAEPKAEPKAAEPKAKAKATGSSVSASDPAVIKVIRVKKNSAVIVFSKNHSPLKPGQRGRVVPFAAGSKEIEVEGPSRKHFIGIDSNFEMLDVKTDPGGGKSSSKAFNANLTYGWNKERFEYGVTLGYAFGTVKDAANAESDNRTILLGGVFDFNFKPNTVENELLFAARLNAAYGQVDKSAQKAAGSVWQIEPGVVVKWFGLSPNLGATGFVGYRMRNDTVDTVKTATSGIVGRIGIQAYF